MGAITGLDKCKFFVLGLKNLILCVDHKPLLAILGDRQNLAEIQNPRLLNFKLKSLMYRFTVRHVPGKDHVIPDTFSRRTDSPIERTRSTSSALKSSSRTSAGVGGGGGPLLGPFGDDGANTSHTTQQRGGGGLNQT